MLNMSKKNCVVKAVLPDYPRANPPREKKTEIFREDNEASAIANSVRNVRVDKNITFHDVVERVTDNISSDVMKTWALFRWVGEQTVKEENMEEDVDEGTPLWYTYKLRTGFSKFYSLLLAVLLREAKIPCVVITGKAKGSAYEVGDLTIKGECSWNAAYIEGGWRLLHPHWAFQSVVGEVTSHWVKVEEEGRLTLQEIQPSSGVKLSALNTFYFLTDPEDFKYFCIPQESQKAWQLIRIPLTHEMYMKLPLLSPAFITSKAQFHFRRGQTNTLTADNGETELILTSENKRWTGQLIYELFYKQESKEDNPQGVAAEKYVIHSNKNLQGEIKFLIRFPIAGTYRLRILNKLKDVNQWLCNFKLVCVKPRANCDPLPVNPEIGWGPGQASKRLGIVAPSHTDGVIQVKKDENLEICFATKLDTNVKTKLKHSKKPDREIQKYVKKKEILGSVSIKVDLPDNDEYALVINAKKPNTSFENALNYIITGAKPKHDRIQHYRNPTIKRLRQSLESAIQDTDKDSLDTAIERFKKWKIEDNNMLLSRAKTRDEFIWLKGDLERAVASGRLDRLEKAIHNVNKSQHVSQLKQLLDKAQLLVEDIKQYSWDARHLHREETSTSIHSPRRILPPLLKP